MPLRSALIFRLSMAAVICIFTGSFSGKAFAQEANTTSTTESAVDKACGKQIESGCIGKLCATGCQKIENGNPVDYGCTFSSKAGKTKATCTKTVWR
jgi:hypothetical protein